MKTVLITIEVPLPDEGTQDDADALAKYITKVALTDNPSLPIMANQILGPAKVYGIVTKVKIKKK
jgi:hypothetical protein